MPRLNTKVNSRNDQQKLRRMREREADFVAKFTENNITCVTFEQLLRGSKSELESLIPIIKKIIQHQEKVNELIASNVFRLEPISANEINTELYEYLQDQYKGIASKTLKYKNSDRKDVFRETIIKENQLQFNNCLTIEAENTIKKFFDDIDISNYEPTTLFYKREEEERKANLKWINTEEKEEEPIIYEPPPPPEPVKTPMKPTKQKKIKKPEPVKAEPVKPEPIKTPMKPETTPPPPYEADYDSEIEADIKALEERERTDQDNNTADDIKTWKKKLNKLWKEDITNAFENINDVDDDDGEYDKTLSHEQYEQKVKNKLLKKYEQEAVSIIQLYINRTKNQTRGTKADIGKWAGRNPVSLKKVITSIVNTIKRQTMKELSKQE